MALIRLADAIDLTMVLAWRSFNSRRSCFSLSRDWRLREARIRLNNRMVERRRKAGTYLATVSGCLKPMGFTTPYPLKKG
jgi:hypothetical protein